MESIEFVVVNEKVYFEKVLISNCSIVKEAPNAPGCTLIVGNDIWYNKLVFVASQNSTTEATGWVFPNIFAYDI